MAAITPTETARPFRGRRMSWREFYALRPDLEPVNDNADQDSLRRLGAPATVASHRTTAEAA
ncbi:hypothetical protein [Mesorhizobium sp. f-mel]